MTKRGQFWTKPGQQYLLSPSSGSQQQSWWGSESKEPFVRYCCILLPASNSVRMTQEKCKQYYGVRASTLSSTKVMGIFYSWCLDRLTYLCVWQHRVSRGGLNCLRFLQEESQGNKDRVTIIIVNGIKSLKQNSVIIDRDYWLKVSATTSQTPKAFTQFCIGVPMALCLLVVDASWSVMSNGSSALIR